MSDQYAAWLDQVCASSSQIESRIGIFRELYSRKLWHEITALLEERISEPEFVKLCPLIDLYHNFIQGFADKINPLKLSLFAVATSKEMIDPYDGQAFLRGVLDSIGQEAVQQGRSGAIDETSSEACLYLEMQIAQYYLIAEDMGKCKEMMDRGLKKLETASEVNNKVAAAVHYVTMQYHKAKSEYANFYRASMLYLAFTSQENLSPEFSEAVAVDVSLAALLGEDVYNFGELLMHPIVETLRSSNGFLWLFDLLECFHQGDIAQYDHLCSVHSKVMNAQPALVAHERRLREKITVLCLINYVSSLPSERKSVPLEDIALKTKLQVDGVEFLLMKALSLHLIEGVIDEVSGTVSITWIAPRVLTIPEIQDLEEKFSLWLTRVESKASELETQAVGITS